MWVIKQFSSVLPVSEGVKVATGVSALMSASVSSWEAKDDGVLLRDDDGQASAGSKERLRSGRVLAVRTRSFSYSSAARRSTFLYLEESEIEGGLDWKKEIYKNLWQMDLWVFARWILLNESSKRSLRGRDDVKKSWMALGEEVNVNLAAGLEVNQKKKPASRRASISSPPLALLCSSTPAPLPTKLSPSTSQPEKRFRALNQPPLTLSLFRSPTPPLSHRAMNVWRFCSKFICIRPLQRCEETGY